MFILLFLGLCIAFLAWGWPIFVTRAIKDRDGGGEEDARYLIWVAAVVAILFWIAIFVPDRQASWRDYNPAITAVGITAGIFFTYSRLLSPSFYATFLEITDEKTGVFKKHPKLDNPKIEQGRWSPVFIAIYNTGISVWDNYRITFDLPKGFEASQTCHEFPECEEWDHAPEPGSLKIGTSYVQKHSTAVLSIGETSACRFFLKANKPGKFSMKVMLTSVGKLNERSRHLQIQVYSNNWSTFPEQSGGQRKREAGGPPRNSQGKGS